MFRIIFFSIIYYLLLVSIHDAFKTVRNEICKQFQNIRQQHDAILLKKQLDILKQLECHERNLLM